VTWLRLHRRDDSNALPILNRMTDTSVLPLHSPSVPPIHTQNYPPMASEKASEPPTARGIASLTVHIPSAFRENAAKPTSKLGNHPSRWSTPEFFFYYLAAFFAIPAMFWIPISLSQGEFNYFLLSLTLN
jgi:hypothetical protein